MDAAFLDRFPLPMTVHDGEGRFLAVNATATRLPFMKTRALLGRTLFEFMAPSVRAAARRSVRDCLSHIRPVEFETVFEAGPQRMPFAARILLMPTCSDGVADGFVTIGFRTEDVEGIIRDASAPAHLTARQAEILVMLAEGRETQEIADRLEITEATVRNHINNVVRELGGGSRAKAVARARRRGMIGEEPLGPADVPTADGRR